MYDVFYDECVELLEIATKSVDAIESDIEHCVSHNDTNDYSCNFALLYSFNDEVIVFSNGRKVLHVILLQVCPRISSASPHLE